MLVENPVTYLSYFKMFYLPEAGFFLWFIWALWLIFFARRRGKIKSRTSRIVRNKFVRYISAIEWPEIFCINFAIRMLKYFMLGIILNEYPRWTEIGKKVPGIIPVCALPALFIFNRVTQKYYINHHSGLYTAVHRNLCNMRPVERNKNIGITRHKNYW